MLNELLMLLFILIIITIIYSMSENGKNNEVIEGMKSEYKYYIGGHKKEALYNKWGKNLMEIEKGSNKLINHKENGQKFKIDSVNSAPDPYHHIFEYKEDKIKIIPKNGEAKIKFDDENKIIDVKDTNNNKTNFIYKGKIICQAKLSNNKKYKYVLHVSDIDMTNFLPLYFVTFILLQRAEESIDNDKK